MTASCLPDREPADCSVLGIQGDGRDGVKQLCTISGGETGLEKVETIVPHQPEGPPIGQRIRAERLRQGMNLRSLARLVNVSPSHISQIETGKTRPSISTLYAITTALGVPLDEIFEEAAHGEEAAADDGAGANPAGLPADGTVLEGKTLTESGQPPDPDRADSPTAEGPAPNGADPAIMAFLSDNVAALAAVASARAERRGPVVTPYEREVLELDSGVTWERLGHVPGSNVDFLLITYAPGSSSSSTDRLMRHPGTQYGFLVTGQLTVTLGFSTFKMTAGDAVCFPSSTPHRYRNEGSEPASGIWFVVEPNPDDRVM
jgi:transcriptional regulator with XRE-family HTH domain/quercetin dioxygenase-like cupin family protein